MICIRICGRDNPLEMPLSSESPLENAAANPLENATGQIRDDFRGVDVWCATFCPCTRLVSNSAPTWSPRCCLTACHS